MKQAKTLKRLLSFLLSFVVLVSTMANALSVFALSVEKLKYPDSYAGSETTYNEVNGESNLLLGNTYHQTADLGALNSGEFTITANAKDANGNLVFSLPFGDGKHLTDGGIKWDSSKVKDIFVTTPDYPDYTYNNRVVTFDSNSQPRNDIWYDFTFRLKSCSDLDKLIVCGSGGQVFYLNEYSIYVADKPEDLYKEESFIYKETNTDSIAQKINFDDNVKGEYLGIRITKPVQDNMSSGSQYAFPHVFEIAALGTPKYTVTTSFDRTKDGVNMIADKTPSGQSITDSIIYKEIPKVLGSSQGSTPDSSWARADRLQYMTDGFYNETDSSKANYKNCDITLKAFAHQDGNTWVFHNGWNKDTKTWNYDNVDSYVQFTYALQRTYTLTDFWVFHENSHPGLTLGAYEIYASSSENDLYNSEHMVARYANVDLSACQKFRFNDTVTAKYFGFKVIMGIQGTAWPQENQARILELALFGTYDKNNDPYTVEYSKPDLSAEMIADTTESGKTIQDNLLYKKTPVLAGKQNGNPTSFYTGNLPRINDGYYNATNSENCDISGVNFVTEPYTYDGDKITGGKYVNGWDPATRTYDENAVDTYATFSYSLDDTYDITDFWMFSQNNNLQTGVYEVYTSLERGSLYNAENLKYTYINKEDAGWAQKVHFNKTSAAKYIGVKVIMGVTTSTWESPWSYMRIIEIAAFGDKSEAQTNARNFIETVDFSNIEIADSFWGGRQDQTLLVSFEHAAKKFEEVGAIRNFKTASKVYKDAIAEVGENATESQVLDKVIELYTDTGKYPAYGGNFASDSDVYKVMEGMAYAIENYKDSTDPTIQAGVTKIEGYLDEWTKLIVDAQGRDGYLNTIFTIYHQPFTWAPNTTPTGRFQNRGMHELYCLGHLYEAAVAIYNATGKTELLAASMKSFDMLYSVFINKNHETYTATFTAPGHEEIELALVKLAATVYDMPEYGPDYAKKCIILAQHYLDTNAKPNGSDLNGKNPANLPVSEITEAWGHCVRAFYLYTGMAELSIAKGEYLYSNLETLWENVETKTYVTGGIGHRSYIEGLPESYELPNDEDLAYCETCASISNVFWNKSMFKIFGESKYFDNIEKQLYNNVLSGVGLDGISFNYTNNLETLEGYLRESWKGTPCCPTNLVRLINKLSEYIYATDKENNTAYVNLYIGSEGSFNLGDTEIGVNMTSSMPWEGEANLTLTLRQAKEFTLKLRLPAWADGANSITINGEDYSATAGEDGYVAITRTWESGDVIAINFPMSVKFVRNGDVIPANKGLVAITRGPITYCVEQQDSATKLDLICVNEESTFSTELVNNFVNDNTYHTAELQVLNVTSKNTSGKAISFRMIPYYAWSNRGKDAMKVYLKDGSELYDSWDSNKTIAGNAAPSATATHPYSPVSKLNDGDKKYDSRWSSWLNERYDLTSRAPTVTYDFDNNFVKLTSTDIYFFTDGGGCQLPETVDIEYWNGTAWVDVTLTNTPELVYQSDYSDGSNKVYLGTYQFNAIITNKIRVNLYHSTRAHAITEWVLNGERVRTTATVSASAETLDGADVTDLAINIANGYIAAGENTFAAASTINYNGKNYGFKYWLVGESQDNNATLTLNASANENYVIKAVYGVGYSVTFIDKNEAEIGTIVTEGAITDQDLTDNNIVPASIFGYTFTNWNHDLSNITTDLTVYPVYNKAEDSTTACVVTLENGTVNAQSTYETQFDNKITAIADNISGKVFSHWENGTGDIVSLNRNYTFYVPSSITLRAVYYNEGDSAPETNLSEIVINSNPLYSINNNGSFNVAFTASVVAPENATVLAQGIIIGGNTYTDAPANLTLESYDLKGEAKNLSRGNFMITLTGVKTGKTRNVRAFVTYKIGRVTYKKYSNSVVRIVAGENSITSTTQPIG